MNKVRPPTLHIVTYLYGDLDAQLHIKPPLDFLPTPTPAQPERFTGFGICKAFYGLKQAGQA